MGQHHVAELVPHERVQLGHVAAKINRPVLAQLFGAQHQHTVVAQLKVFDDSQRGIGLTQAHAVGQDAAVVCVDFLYRTLDAIFLKFKKCFPNFGIGNCRVVKELGLLLLAGQELFKHMEQGLEIDELRGMVYIELGQVFQHLGFDIFDLCGV